MLIRINGTPIEDGQQHITDGLKILAQHSGEALAPNMHGQEIVHQFLHQNDPTGVYDWVTGVSSNVTDTALLTGKYGMHFGAALVKGVMWDTPVWISNKFYDVTGWWIHEAVVETAKNCPGGVLHCQ